MELLERGFEKIGARVKFNETRPIREGGLRMVQNLASDVRTDARGEFFSIARNHEAVGELIALDMHLEDKHLLLLSRENGEKHRFLPGPDERHWFVDRIPESSPVSTGGRRSSATPSTC